VGACPQRICIDRNDHARLFDLSGYVGLGTGRVGLSGRVKDILESKLPLSRTEQVTLAHVLTSRSLFAFRMGKYEQAYAMLTRSLEILRPLNEPRILVEAVTFMGIITIITGDLAGSSKLFMEGLQSPEILTINGMKLYA